MATPTAKTRMNGATKTKTTATTKVAAKPNNPALTKLTSWVRSTYGVNLLKREETLAVAAYYGLRERLGMKLQTEISLKSNGSKRPPAPSEIKPTGKSCAAWRERSEVSAAPMDGKASVDASGMSCANSIHPLQI
jgi:hypothetical protein